MVRMPWRSRWWRGILAIVVIAPLVATLLIFWRASQANDEAAAEFRAKSEFPFRLVSFDRTAPPGVDAAPAVAAYRDLATFKDTIAVSARAGLFLYDRSGSLVRTYRTG